jgi:hypothetical protein
MKNRGREMEISFKPRLRHCTLIDEPDGNVTTLVVGTDYFDLSREVGNREDLLSLKSRLDGRHNIFQISEETGLAIDDVLRAVEAFSEAGLLQVEKQNDEVDKGLFLERVEATSLMWRRQIGLHRLFSGLSTGTFRQEVFVGLLLETYHYVKRLSPLLVETASSWAPSRLRDAVLDYAREEMDHHLSYAEALEKLGRLRGHVASSHPTIGTLALLSGFESVGRRSELGLVCCLQLIEARPSEQHSAEAHLSKIASIYGLDQLVVPFVEHMKADLDLGHANLLGQALTDAKLLTLRDVDGAINHMHDLKHFFDIFHDNIIIYYSDISNYIPRPRVEFSAL